MRLELNVINIKKVQFGAKTAIANGILSINRDELKELLKEDPRLGNIDIELAHPGEKCRITRVMDAVEPRARLNSNGVDFPGAVGKQGMVGHGTTCVLRGAAVLTSEAFPATGPSIRAVGSILDMWGPGAEVGPYAKTCNVIIIPSPSSGTVLPEYQLALKIAGLKTAVYLASTGAELTPDKVEVYDIPPLVDAARESAELPRVVYIMQLFSNQQLPLPGDPVLYGDNINGIVPAILHPNEVFDGAISVPYRSNALETYTVQNHPILEELYRHHGKSLYLAGVIVTYAANNGPDIQRISTIAATLAKWTLGANGAILTKYGGGAPEMTMAEMGRRCEEMGIKTVLAINHAGMDITETTLKVSTIFSNVPGVDAMVSLGTAAGGPNLTLPAAERVIGMPDGTEMAGELVRPAGQIKGAQSLVGSTKWMAVRY